MNYLSKRFKKYEPSSKLGPEMEKAPDLMLQLARNIFGPQKESRQDTCLWQLQNFQAPNQSCNCEEKAALFKVIKI